MLNKAFSFSAFERHNQELAALFQQQHQQSSPSSAAKQGFVSPDQISAFLKISQERFQRNHSGLPMTSKGQETEEDARDHEVDGLKREPEAEDIEGKSSYL